MNEKYDLSLLAYITFTSSVSEMLHLVTQEMEAKLYTMPRPICVGLRLTSL